MIIVVLDGVDNRVPHFCGNTRKRARGPVCDNHRLIVVQLPLPAAPAYIVIMVSSSCEEELDILY